jgi:predicted Zn-dependent protease
MTRSCRFALVALVAAWLILLSTPARAALISEKQEIAIGKQTAAEVEREYRVDTDLTRNERLNRVAAPLLRVAERKLDWQLRILDIPQVNALAVPGGFIYTTRGLMEKMPDRELAFVLAHELQHVERRHSIRQLESSLYRQLGVLAAIQLLSKGRVSQGTSNTIALANMVVSNRYTQDMEREADSEGIRMMARAGLDPHGAVEALRTLQSNNKSSMPKFLNSLVGTHPLTKDRIRHAEELAGSLAFTAVPVPDVQAPVTDSVREAQVMLALESGPSPLSPDPDLMRLALDLQAPPLSESRLEETRGLVVWTFPETLTESQVNHGLMNQEIPRVLGSRTFQHYGVSIVQLPESQRRVVLVVR